MTDTDKSEMASRASDAAPAAGNAELPAMGGGAGPVTMDDASAARVIAAYDGRPAMTDPAPMSDVIGEEDPAPEGGYPDMEPPDAGDGGASASDFAAGPHGEAYLRLVVNVDEGVMTVADGSVVAGRLATQPDLTGEMVCQATIDGRRVGADAYPDLKEIHSLAPPDDPDRGHHHAELESFDFVVRIPREDVTVEDLERLQIELINTRKTTEISQSIAPMPGETFEAAAAKQALDTPAVLSRMEGVRLERLPDAAAEAIRKGLR